MAELVVHYFTNQLWKNLCTAQKLAQLNNLWLCTTLKLSTAQKLAQLYFLRAQLKNQHSCGKNSTKAFTAFTALCISAIALYQIQSIFFNTELPTEQCTHCAMHWDMLTIHFRLVKLCRQYIQMAISSKLVTRAKDGN